LSVIFSGLDIADKDGLYHIRTGSSYIAS